MDMPTPKQLMIEIQKTEQGQYDTLVAKIKNELIKSWKGGYHEVTVSLDSKTSPRVIDRVRQTLWPIGWIVTEKNEQREGSWLVIKANPADTRLAITDPGTGF